MSKRFLEEFFIPENLYGTIIKDKLAVSVKHLKKGTFIDLHWHDYFEIEIVTRGNVEHIYNNECEILSRGDGFLMSYYDFHSIRCLNDVEIINIRFYDNFLEKELSERLSIGGCFVFDFDEAELDVIYENINKIFYEHNDDRLFKETMVKSILSEIVIDVIRKSNVDTKSGVASIVQKAIRYIYKNFRKDISVEKLAEQFNTSTNYFGALFKKNVGVSFNEYINKIRLKYACDLLETSQLTVKEIAFESGYNSVEYFLYVFKKNLGITPNGYRKAHKN